MKSCVFLRLPKQRVEVFSSVLDIHAGALDQFNSGTRFKIITEIGVRLFLDPLGLRFGTLIVPAGIEESAVAAAVQVRVAVRTGFRTGNLCSRQQLHGRAALVAAERDIVHTTCRLPQIMRRINDPARPAAHTCSRCRPAWLPLALLAVMIAASFGCGGTPPKTQYYVLHIPAPAPAPGQKLEKTAMVMRFDAPRMLEQDRIVYRPGKQEVGFYEYHRWAEDPRSVMTRSLLEQLRARGTFANVVAFDGRTKADYIVRGRIDRLEEVDADGGVTAHVALSAELIDAETRKPVWEGKGGDSAQVSVGEVSSVVAQMSRAAESSVGKLAAGLDAFLRSGAARPAQ